MTNWRRSTVVALAGVVVFLVIQLGVPISRMGSHDHAQRFGWQMFSIVAEATEFTVHTTSGEETIALEDVLARVRGDLPLPDLLPPFLCETVPGAETVTWNEESYTCSPG